MYLVLKAGPRRFETNFKLHAYGSIHSYIHVAAAQRYLPAQPARRDSHLNSRAEGVIVWCGVPGIYVMGMSLGHTWHQWLSRGCRRV